MRQRTLLSPSDSTFLNIHISCLALLRVLYTRFTRPQSPKNTGAWSGSPARSLTFRGHVARRLYKNTRFGGIDGSRLALLHFVCRARRLYKVYRVEGVRRELLQYLQLHIECIAEPIAPQKSDRLLSSSSLPS